METVFLRFVNIKYRYEHSDRTTMGWQPQKHPKRIILLDSYSAVSFLSTVDPSAATASRLTVSFYAVTLICKATDQHIPSSYHRPKFFLKSTSSL